MEKDILHKEIDLIQDMIKRMAANSFLLKGWLISLVAVILALTKESILTPHNAGLYLILLFPVGIFWYLDAYFLQMEKRYRKLFDWVVTNRLAGNNEQLYNLNHLRFKDQVGSLISIMFSQTLAAFYLIPVAFLLLLLAISFLKK